MQGLLRRMEEPPFNDGAHSWGRYSSYWVSQVEKAA